jgi:hypothetical protein
VAITQVNNYMPGKNLARLTVNEDYDRIGNDRVFITVNPATVPATITVLEGSIIECNGNTYVLDADESFQMANAAHEYITFTDNPAPAFSSQAGPGTFDPELQGYYTGNARVLRFFIDQGGTTGILLLDNKIWDLTPMTLKYDRIRVYMNSNMSGDGVMPFDRELYDSLGNFNTGTYRFTCTESGYYFVTLFATLYWYGPPVLVTAYLYIRKNGISISELYFSKMNRTYPFVSTSCYTYMNKGDYIDCYATSSVWAIAHFILAGLEYTSLSIMRLE